MANCFFAGSGTTSFADPTDLDDASQGVSGRDVRREPPDVEPTDSTAAELVMSQFRELVGSLFRAPAARKRSLRSWVIQDLAVGRRLTERVEFILEYALQSSKPTRLDDAIDILDNSQVDLTAYLRNAQFQQSLDRKQDDAIYILVRAAGRRSDNAARFVVPWAIKSLRPSVREAAVESLADLRTVGAISMLRNISATDESPSVREAAEEALEDILED